MSFEGACPDQTWETVGTKCFKVETGVFSSAQDASAYCGDLNANLAHIETETENSTLLTLVINIHSFNSPKVTKISTSTIYKSKNNFLEYFRCKSRM